MKKLVGISLQEITPDSTMIALLLMASARNLADASGVLDQTSASLDFNSSS